MARPYFYIDDIAHVRYDEKNISKLCVSVIPGKYGDISHDLEYIKNRNIKVIVCLLEWSELMLIGLEDYPMYAQEAGFFFYHFPIKDHHAPDHLEDCVTLIKRIAYHLDIGDNVLVHCKGGLGRAGTISSCCLCYMGYKPEDAVSTVRLLRHKSIKRENQVNFVINYHNLIFNRTTHR